MTLNNRHFFLSMLKTYSVRVSPPDQPFTLASGEKSRFYVDVKKTSLRKDVQLPLAHLLCNELIRFEGVDAVAGVALGGCHLASVAGYESAKRSRPVDVLHIRKEAKDHGTKNLIEAPGPIVGDRVVLFEDVVTTGGSSLKAVAVLQEAKYTVLGIVTVVDRRAIPSKLLDGLALHSLYTLADFATG